MAAFCFEIFLSASLANNGQVRLIQLQPIGTEYMELEMLFYRGWKHQTKGRPRVLAIYKVTYPPSALQPFLDYKEALSQSGCLPSQSRERAIEELLFHGTTRACLLGDTPYNTLPCNLPQCSLCKIIRESFDVKCCGLKNAFSRFGAGIYTTSCSSKADDYVQNVSKNARTRALLLSRVITGRPKELEGNAVNLTAPPVGYNSVIGVPGNDLNYEETVVYTNEAIRPSYIFVYDNTQPCMGDVRFDLPMMLGHGTVPFVPGVGSTPSDYLRQLFSLQLAPFGLAPFGI
ncbi:ADP-ribosylation [Laetiporus sulphureus 93-53]|uniref:ADP-ribosylation n=1 Tax=Laetiporus sulphureus 93-53 TaxID=1314785 RepID=A0A165BRV2_9APHY|nr:ADP-ribosylation [Laetiporus sulphureus 93-53]KZT01540.1 ADP-ribosylation [Laetiporus sulphureus 93-53]